MEDAVAEGHATPIDRNKFQNERAKTTELMVLILQTQDPGQEAHNHG
jgi:hypothetical protein